MQLRAVRRAVLVAAAPGLALRMRVEARYTFPGGAAVVAERNSPCGDVPAHQTPGCDAWPGVSQNVWSTTRPLSGANFGGVAASFHVRPPSVERNTVGPRWPVLRGREQRLAVARVEHGVMHDVPEELRPRELPGAPRGVGRQRPQALARGDQQAHAAWRDGAGFGDAGGHDGILQ